MPFTPTQTMAFIQQFGLPTVAVVALAWACWKMYVHQRDHTIPREVYEKQFEGTFREFSDGQTKVVETQGSILTAIEILTEIHRQGNSK